MFCFEHTGVRPDILTLGKGIGAGTPLAAVLAREEVCCFDPGAHWIELQLDMNDASRTLAIRTVDDGRELEPGAFMFQPGPDTILEESVVEGLGLHLVRTYIDEMRYRREDGRNHLGLSKKIGN